ncbi:hypothetical protein [Vulgatibacter sp.]|uniref:hypothetical protein n=1 Tax=Vulgatibacter sp. TaxID=1971226 RepID=UPI00356998C8
MRAAILCCLLLAACAGAPPTSPAPAPDRCGMDVMRLVADEVARRPAAAPADIYLLVREAILGPTATGPDLEAVLATVEPAAQEPIVEDLDEVQGTVRVNLRKWRFIRGSAAELQVVVERSLASPDEGARERLAACLERAPAAWAAAGGDASVLRSYLDAQRENAWPPVEHSEKYRRDYQPAYRVVLRRHLPPWVTAPPPTTG